MSDEPRKKQVYNYTGTDVTPQEAEMAGALIHILEGVEEHKIKGLVLSVITAADAHMEIIATNGSCDIRLLLAAVDRAQHKIHRTMDEMENRHDDPPFDAEQDADSPFRN